MTTEYLNQLLNVEYRDYLREQGISMHIPSIPQKNIYAIRDSTRSQSVQEVPRADSKRQTFYNQRPKDQAPHNSISFTKDERFRSQMSSQINDTPLIINNNIGYRRSGVKFGMTKRSQFYLNTISRAKQTPSPFEYFKQEGSKIKVKKCPKCKVHLNRNVSQEKNYQNCCTFGNSYEKYRKLGSFDVKLYQSGETPGIGSYDANYGAIKRSSQNCIIIPRRQDLQEFSSTQKVSPTTYNPLYSQILVHRNKNPHMGLGNKLDLSKPLNVNPGPGAYQYMNTFMKTHNSQHERYLREEGEGYCNNKICSVTRGQMYCNIPRCQKNTLET